MRYVYASLPLVGLFAACLAMTPASASTCVDTNCVGARPAVTSNEVVAVRRVAGPTARPVARAPVARGRVRR